MKATGIIIRVVAGLAIAGAGAWVVARQFPGILPWKTSEGVSVRDQIETVAARRGELRVVFVESGKVRAIKSEKIFPKVQGRQLMITWLAPQGAKVAKDEKLVTFDSKEFDEALIRLTAELEGAKQQLIVEQAALDIQRTTSKAQVKAAESRLAEVSVLYRTYRDLEAPKRLNELDTQSTDQRKKLNEAKAAVVEARRQLDEQLFTEEDQRRLLERQHSEAEQTVRTIERILENNLTQKKIFRQYEYPQQLSSKKEAVENAELEQEKAKVTALQEIRQKEAVLKKVQELIARTERQIADTNNNIKNCTILSPTDGLVIYGDPSAGYYTERQIAVGSQWYAGNALMTIPDLSSFEIDINIPEDYRGRVQPGVPVVVTVDAIPDLRITGKLKEISQLGSSGPYYDPEGTMPKTFRTIVSLDSHDLRMVSGMTARVEIIADVVPDALLVPVEAVFNDQGKPVVYLKEAHGLVKREVTTGKRNDSMVQILAGATDGAVLSVVEPTDFTTPGATSRPSQP